MRGSERRSAGTGQGLPLMSKCELTTRQARGTGPGHPGGGEAGLPRSGATSVDAVSRPGDVEPGPSPQPRPLRACPHAVWWPDLVPRAPRGQGQAETRWGLGPCLPASPADAAPPARRA